MQKKLKKLSGKETHLLMTDDEDDDEQEQNICNNPGMLRYLNNKIKKKKEMYNASQMNVVPV